MFSAPTPTPMGVCRGWYELEVRAFSFLEGWVGRQLGWKVSTHETSQYHISAHSRLQPPRKARNDVFRSRLWATNYRHEVSPITPN